MAHKNPKPVATPPRPQPPLKPPNVTPHRPKP
jgi:hypothetical protein